MWYTPLVYPPQVFDFKKVSGAQYLDKNGEKQRNRPSDIIETTCVRDLHRADARSYGTYMFLEFVHRYLRIFVIRGRKPRDIIKDAVFCILFIGLWRRDIKLRRLSNQATLGPNNVATLVENFITTQTATDVLITCNMVVLLSILFTRRFPNIRMDLSRISSRFSEYVFQV